MHLVALAATTRWAFLAGSSCCDFAPVRAAWPPWGDFNVRGGLNGGHVDWDVLAVPPRGQHCVRGTAVRPEWLAMWAALAAGSAGAAASLRRADVGVWWRALADSMATAACWEVWGRAVWGAPAPCRCVLREDVAALFGGRARSRHPRTLVAAVQCQSGLAPSPCF